ncbi:MAG: proton-conducting transporter membrane subunit [archaeon]
MITSFLSIPALLIAAFLIPVAGIHEKKMAPYIALSATAFSLLASILTIPEIIEKKILVYYMGGWAAPYGIAIVVDSFSLMVIILVTLIGFLATLFSLKYIKASRAEYYSLLCLLLVGLLGITHTGDLFNLFVFLEITSLSSYALTSFYAEKKSIEAAIKYLIMGAFATSLVLLAIALAYGLTGTLNMADLARILKSSTSPTVPIIMGMLLTGLAFKSAIVPLHAWKPDVIEATPVPIGAIFASASTTVSIYAIIRVAYTIFSAPLTYTLLIAGTITMLLGAIMALQQKDILRLLAYSAISQVGYILIAFATDATSGIYHLFNVAIIEALLFFSIGAVMISTKESDMTHLGRLTGHHPVIPAAFMIGILSNAGIPLLNGFSSKWLIYTTTLQSYPVIMIAAILTSVLTLAYSLKAYQLIFRSRNIEQTNQKNIDPKILATLLILMMICIYFGIFAGSGAEISGNIASTLSDNTQYIKAVLKL